MLAFDPPAVFLKARSKMEDKIEKIANQLSQAGVMG